MTVVLHHCIGGIDLLRRGAITTVIPECDFVAGFHVAGRAHNHHVPDKSAAGVAGAAGCRIYFVPFGML